MATIDALAGFVFRSAHAEVMKVRRKWFVPLKEAYVALWWVPSGLRPSVVEAEERLIHLRVHGPTPIAFTLKQPFGPLPSVGMLTKV